MYFSSLISGAVLFHSIAGYVLEDDFSKDFYNQFSFFTGGDPTNGFVKYISQADAQKAGLIKNAAGGAIASWGMDSTNKAPGGRPSIRLESKKTYDSGLIVVDVQHMPVGCGTWPAFWTYGSNWPANGEIDIIEGVNEQETNAVALHTSPGCSVAGNLGNGNQFTAKIKTPNCDVKAPGQPGNAGCGVSQVEKNSYGKSFNDNKGGVYATEWNDDAISVWFFPRQSIPKDLSSGSPNPKTWGKPAARFASTTCNIKTMFNKQRITFTNTLCGDWAGNVWTTGSCASKAKTCIDFVRDNPSAFANAFWTINSLKVYQNNGKTPAPSSAPPTPPKTSAKPIVSSVTPPKSSTVVLPPKSSAAVSSAAPPKSSVAVSSAAPPKSSGVVSSNKPSGSPVKPSSGIPSATKGSNTPSTSIRATAIPITSGFPVVDPSTLFGTTKTAKASGAPSGSPSAASSKSTLAPPASISASFSVLEPSKMPGFTWPTQGSSRPQTSTGTAPIKSSGLPISYPTGTVKFNQTMYTPSSTPKYNQTSFYTPGSTPTPESAISNRPTTIKTVPSNSLRSTTLPVSGTPKAVSGAPSKTSGGAPLSSTTCTGGKTPSPKPSVVDVETKIETVVHTVVVTVPPASAKTPTPYGKQARQVRQHRKRIVAHNVRR